MAKKRTIREIKEILCIAEYCRCFLRIHGFINNSTSINILDKQAAIISKNNIDDLDGDIDHVTVKTKYSQ